MYVACGARLIAFQFLYKSQVVFPDRQELENSKGFTLQQGRHEWPFSFRIPVNARCQASPRAGYATSGGMAGSLLSGLTTPQPRVQHVSNTLPPSFFQSPRVHIRYFVKCTISRPGFLKRNRRVYQPFVFLPIEPPRPPSLETPFRVGRVHHLRMTSERTAGSGFLSRLFGSRDTDRQALPLEVEVLLPNPVIFVPGLPIDFRVKVQRTDSYAPAKHVSVVAVSVTLVCYNLLIACEHVRRGAEYLSLIQNAAVHGDVTIGRALVINSQTLGRPLVVPTNVPPTFTTCNIRRHYELLIGLDVQCESGRPERVELLAPAAVFSGIAPPEGLLRTNESPARRAPSPPPRPPARPPPGDQKHASDAKTSPQTQVPDVSGHAASSSSAPVLSGSSDGVFDPADEGILPSYDEAVGDILPGHGGNPASLVPAQQSLRPHYEVGQSYFSNLESDDVGR